MKILMCEHWPLGQPLQVGSHQLCREFVRRGHEVLWLADPLHLPRNPLRLASDPEVRWRWRYWWEGPHRRPGAVDVLPATLLPWVDLPGLRRPAVLDLSLRLTVPSVARLLAREGFSEPDLLWLTYPSLARVRELVKPRFTVHRRTDVYEEFAGFPPGVAAVAADLVRRADLVVTPARDMTEAARALNPNSHHLPNAADVERLLAMPRDLPAEYRARPGRRFVYVGGCFRILMDPALVADLARAFPDDGIFLIGPGDLGPADVGNAPNVHFLGVRPYERLGAYLANADLGLVPFCDSRISQPVNPLKLYEYAAFGLPIVARRLPELERMGSPARLAYTGAEFVAAARAALAEPPDRDGLLAYARANTWRARVDRVMALLGLAGA